MSPKQKPEKPYPEFPMTALANGQWGKKIHGKIYYFGVWADSDAALAKYLVEKDDLFARRKPATRDVWGVTVYEICNRFLEAKEKLMDNGERSSRTFHDYKCTCEKICRVLGRERAVETLESKDFVELRSKFAEGVGLVRLGNLIQHTRYFFLYESGNDIISKPVKFGSDFAKPTKRTVRIERQAKPKKLFTSKDLREIIEAAKTPIKAMILLGINCGFGQTDCSSIPIKSIDFNDSWCKFPRPKTGIPRECPLWPETIYAIKEAIKCRPKQVSDELTDRLFVTRSGTEYVRFSNKGTSVNGISRQFDRLLRKLKMTGQGRTFYALRHTLETIGGDAGDQTAVDAIMGHVPDDGDMGALYRQAIFRKRLKKITENVRKWLWPPKR